MERKAIQNNLGKDGLKNVIRGMYVVALGHGGEWYRYRYRKKYSVKARAKIIILSSFPSDR